KLNQYEIYTTEEVKVITGDAQVEGRQADIYQYDMDHAIKVLSMQEDKPEILEAVEVVTTAKLITEVVATVSETVSAVAIDPTETVVVVHAATVTPAPVKVDVPSTRRRRRVIPHKLKVKQSILLVVLDLNPSVAEMLNAAKSRKDC
nr:hypothetical protein [Tanacetum cinerariifolium]